MREEEKAEYAYLSSEAVPRDADIDCVKSFPAGGGRTVNLSCEEDRACAGSPYSTLSRPLLGEADELEQGFVQARLVDQKGDGGRFSSWDDQPATLGQVGRSADLDDGEPGLLGQRVQGMDVFGEGALECAGGDSGQSRNKLDTGKDREGGSQDPDCVPGWCVPHAARSRRRQRVHVPVYAVSVGSELTRSRAAATCANSDPRFLGQPRRWSRSRSAHLTPDHLLNPARHGRPR